MTDWPELADSANAALLGSALAEDVTYTAPGGGAPQSVRGVFSHEHVTVDPETSVEVVSQRPNVWLRAADLAAPAVVGARVDARGAVWIVAEPPQRSGDGGVLLLLHGSE